MKVHLKLIALLTAFLLVAPTAWADAPSPWSYSVTGLWTELLSSVSRAADAAAGYVSGLVSSEADQEELGGMIIPIGLEQAGEQGLGGHIDPIGLESPGDQGLGGHTDPMGLGQPENSGLGGMVDPMGLKTNTGELGGATDPMGFEDDPTGPTQEFGGIIEPIG